MANFEWTDEQRAKLVPGARVTVHWDDVGEQTETVITTEIRGGEDRIRVKDGGSSLLALLRLADPESVVAP